MTEILQITGEWPSEAEDIPELCLATLMRGCRLVDPAGCSWENSLCDDEFGIMANCPGQAMRRAYGSASTDE